MAYFSSNDSTLEAFLKKNVEKVNSHEVENGLNDYLATMWDDHLHDTHLANDIKTCLLARGWEKEAINRTNREKAWQRRKEVYGIESDPAEKVRTWLSNVSHKVSRLFRRR